MRRYVRDRSTELNLQRVNELLHAKLPTLRTRKGTGAIDCGCVRTPHCVVDTGGRVHRMH